MKFISLVLLILFLQSCEEKSDIITDGNASAELVTCDNPYSSFGHNHNVILDDLLNYFENNHEYWHEDTMWIGDTIYIRKDLINILIDQTAAMFNNRSLDTTGFYIYANHINNELIIQNLVKTVNNIQYIPAIGQGFDAKYMRVFVNEIYTGSEDSLQLQALYSNLFNGNFTNVDQILYQKNICTLDSVLHPSTLKMLSVYDSSYSYWTNVRSETPFSHGNYPFSSKKSNNKKNNKVQGPKEVAIQNVTNAFDIAIIAGDGVGGMLGVGWGAPLVSAFILANKIVVLNDMQNCLCDVCGKRLTIPGC